MPADVIDQEMEASTRSERPSTGGLPLEGCENRHALGYPRQATFHPLKYLAGVAKACSESGVTFFRDSPVEEVTEDNGVVTVKMAQGIVRAQHAVVATNSSISDRLPFTGKRLPTGPT